MKTRVSARNTSLCQSLSFWIVWQEFFFFFWTITAQRAFTGQSCICKDGLTAVDSITWPHVTALTFTSLIDLHQASGGCKLTRKRVKRKRCWVRGGRGVVDKYERLGEDSQKKRNRRQKGENDTGLRLIISQLRTSGFRNWGHLGFHLQRFIVETQGGERRLAESQVIPQLKGRRRVLAFTHCWGNGGVCQMSAPYP